MGHAVWLVVRQLDRETHAHTSGVKLLDYASAVGATGPSGPSGYDIAALIIAGLAAAMALAALVWNIAEYRLTEPRVKAHLMFGAAGAGGLVSKRGSPPSDWCVIASQGFTAPLIGVELVNRGRASTEVHHFGCRLSNEFSINDVGHMANKPLPFILEPHRSAMFWVPAQEVIILVGLTRQQGRPAKTAHMEVEITGPKTVRTKLLTL